MKKVLHLLVCVLLSAPVMIGCEDKDPEPTPIAPILKETTMPAEDNALPGTDVRIIGKGFAAEDILHFTSKSGESNFDPEIVSVSDQDIYFKMPEEAGGIYEISVQRGELTSKLPGELKVPYLLVLSNVEIPTAPIAINAEFEIKANGFESGDEISFAPSGQPAGTTFTATTTITADGIKVTIPEKCFGAVSITGVRGTGETQRKVSLGEIKVPITVGTAAGGGVVFHVTDGGVHGFIVTNALSGNYNFGPYKGAGTIKTGIGEGKTNTANYITFINNYRLGNTWETKTAPEHCTELSKEVNGITYDDWFLPSKDELAAVFYARATISAAALSFPANNYWSSSEWENDINWATWYINFYEPENLVTDGANKEGWTIGIIPVRSF